MLRVEWGEENPVNGQFDTFGMTAGCKILISNLLSPALILRLRSEEREISGGRGAPLIIPKTTRNPKNFLGQLPFELLVSRHAKS